MNRKSTDLLELTRPSAYNFLEDAAYLDGLIVHSEPSRGELRRLSAVLRRLVVEEGLNRIASPRLGKLNIRTFDTKQVETAYRTSTNLVFFMLGSPGQLYGSNIRLARMQRESRFSKGSAFSNDLIDVKLQAFGRQIAFVFNKTLITRNDIIKYAALKLDGVHYSNFDKMDEKEKVIKQLQSTVYVERDGNRYFINIDPLGKGSKNPNFVIEAVLSELFHTAYYLMNSPDILRLIEVIRQERVQYPL